MSMQNGDIFKAFLIAFHKIDGIYVIGSFFHIQ